MKRNVSKLKKKAVNVRQLLGLDQPFDYEEMVSAVGPQYVSYVNRDGIAVLPYEKLKSNYLYKKERGWRMAV